MKTRTTSALDAGDERAAAVPVAVAAGVVAGLAALRRRRPALRSRQHATPPELVQSPLATTPPVEHAAPAPAPTPAPSPTASGSVNVVTHPHGAA